MNYKHLYIIRFLLFTGLFCLMASTVSAQSIVRFDDRNAKAHFPNVSLGSYCSEPTIIAYLTTLIPNLRAEGVSLELLHRQSSFYGEHFTYQQYYRNIPIYGTEIKLNMASDGIVISVFENSYNVKALETVLNTQKEKKRQKAPKVVIHEFIAETPLQVQETAQQMFFFETETEPVLGIYFMGGNTQTGDESNYIVDYNGVLLYQKSRHLHCKPSTHNINGTTHQCTVHHPEMIDFTAAPPQTATTTENQRAKATAWVFNPNPLTSANQRYGGDFIDDNDDTNAALNSQLQEVEIDVTFSNGEYELKSEYIEMTNLRAPHYAPTIESQPVFKYNRSEYDFEAVNVYYHINEIQNYIQALPHDFSQLKEGILSDAHATTSLGDDNSVFQPGNPSTILFGPGNVDDGEDADVIIHEYGHAISHFANNNVSFNNERSAIDEGFGDYLAASYSRSLNPDFGWDIIFNWDAANLGHERNANSSKRYPTDINGNKYADCEIWSSSLMDIWGELGRETTDMLVIGALYQYTSSTDMGTAAQALLTMDNVMNAGENRATLEQLLLKRGLLEYAINAGSPQTVCLGDTITLGDNNQPLEDAEVFWEPTDYVIDNPTSWTPQFTPDETGYIRLTITDWNTRSIFQDSVLITVKYCLDNITPSESIQIVNSDRFFWGRGNAIIDIPATYPASTLDIFDSNGRYYTRYELPEGPYQMELNPAIFGQGVYMLRFRSGEDKDSEEVLKIARGGR